MSAAPQLDSLEPSPLASARLQRKLTVDEAARRAGISPEQIRWLEEGRVDRVLNGGGDIYYTRALASKIGGLGYKIRRVTKANRFDYPTTAVYFEPGGDAYGARLAGQLGVEAKPLPGGSNPRRLVVIAGPPRVG